MFVGCKEFVAKLAGRETPISEVAGSNPIPSKALLFRGLYLFFLFSLIKLSFLSCSC